MSFGWYSGIIYEYTRTARVKIKTQKRSRCQKFETTKKKIKVIYVTVAESNLYDVIIIFIKIIIHKHSGVCVIVFESVTQR